MNPRTASIIALSPVAIAALIVLFNYLKDDPFSTMEAGAKADQTRNSDRKREGNSTKSKEEQVREATKKQLTFWSQNASAGLAIYDSRTVRLTESLRNRIKADIAANQRTAPSFIVEKSAKFAGLDVGMTTLKPVE